MHVVTAVFNLKDFKDSKIFKVGSFDEFLTKVKQISGISSIDIRMNDITFKYKDEDEDYINFNTEEEWSLISTEHVKVRICDPQLCKKKKFDYLKEFEDDNHFQFKKPSFDVSSLFSNISLEQFGSIKEELNKHKCPLCNKPMGDYLFENWWIVYVALFSVIIIMNGIGFGRLFKLSTIGILLVLLVKYVATYPAVKKEINTYSGIFMRMYNIVKRKIEGKLKIE